MKIIEMTDAFKRSLSSFIVYNPSVSILYKHLPGLYVIQQQYTLFYSTSDHEFFLE